MNPFEVLQRGEKICSQKRFQIIETVVKKVSYFGKLYSLAESIAGKLPRKNLFKV